MNLDIIQMPELRVDALRHIGPYNETPDAFAPASGHHIGPGVRYEVYLNTPMTARPAELQTEMRVPADGSSRNA